MRWHSTAVTPEDVLSDGCIGLALERGAPDNVTAVLLAWDAPEAKESEE